MSRSRHSKRGHWYEFWSKRASIVKIVGWAKSKYGKIITHRIERRLAKQQIREELSEE